MTKVLRRFLQFAVALIAIHQGPAWAATFTVNSTADAVDAKRGDGVCETAPGNGICTLRAAIQESNTLAGADTIMLPAGTYTITIAPFGSNDANGSFDIKDSLTIVGAGADVTIVDGGGLDSVFASPLAGKTINISNLTIQNGAVPASKVGGGVVAMGNSNLTLTNVVIQNNRAGDGGGIYNQGNLTLIRCVVRGNTATLVTQDTSKFRQGGGIFHTGGELLVRESTISGNTAISGGGLANGGDAVIESSTISGNVALNNTLNDGDAGGGIVNGAGASGFLTIVNSTISGNRANGNHGGIHNFDGDLELSSVTITDNAADADGDGFGNSGGLGMGINGTLTMRNTILAGNRAAGTSQDCFNFDPAALTSAGFNLIGDSTGCPFTLASGDLVGASGSPIDPGLKPLADYGGATFTHALAATSPVVDAGDPSGCTDGTNALTTDQRGSPRTVAANGGAARCDIGAYEMTRPVANAGADQRVNGGALVSLDGSGSTPSGLTFAWTQTAGVPVALAAADSASPSFTAPTVPGALTFQLTITDRAGNSASATVTVTVNAPPVADAGADQTVDAGANVTLNGTGSRDSDGVITSFTWIQTAGTPVTLANASTANPSFSAPSSGGSLAFQLTVTDNEGASSSDSVTVAVTVPPPPPPPPEPTPPPTQPPTGNKAPVANAGADETVQPHSYVVLNGLGSYDPDGKIVKYRWTQIGGTPVYMYGGSLPFMYFIAPAKEGPLTFQLTVTDNKGATGTDTVTITVSHCAKRWYHQLFHWWDHHRHDECRYDYRHERRNHR